VQRLQPNVLVSDIGMPEKMATLIRKLEPLLQSKEDRFRCSANGIR